MKSFFKKLSFVLAFAMIVTMIPATSAKAADVKTAEIAVSGTSEVLSGEVVELAVGETLKVTYLGVPDWKAIAGKTFTSSNEDVAAFNADNRTLVAKSAGATEINFICGDYVIAPFVVVVPQTEYTVNLSLGKIDGVWDLNRTEYAFESATAPAKKFVYAGYYDGAATKTLVSSDKNVVTVNNDGTVTPVADGTATVYMTVKNTATGKTTLCAPMEVTVGSGIGTTAPVVVGSAFKAQQVSETKVNLVFANAAAAKAAAEQEIVFEADFYGVFLDISFKQDVVVKDNVVTVESMSSLSDGWTYKFTIGSKESTFVASVGKVASVDFTWKNVDEAGVAEDEWGVAYVNDDELPTSDSFVLVPKFYDANGIDVTATVMDSDEYEDPDFDLAVDSDIVSGSGDEWTFDEKGTVAFKMTYTYTIEAEDDEEEDKEVTLEKVKAITASVRPERTFQVVDFALVDSKETGFTAQTGANKLKGILDAQEELQENFNSIVAAKGTKTIYLGDDDDYYFAALIKDNYGNTYVYPNGEEQPDTNISFEVDYSKETVFSAAAGSVFTVAPGTGSIVFYAVNNETDKKTFIGSQKLTVKAARVPSTIDISATSASVPNNADNSASYVVVTVKDQYGRVVTDMDAYLGAFECTTKWFDDEKLPLGPYDSSSKGYVLDFDGSWFSIDELDKNGNTIADPSSLTGYKTVKSRKYTFVLNIDKDIERNAKLNKSSLKFDLTVVNTEKYANEMTLSETDDTATVLSNFYYSVGQTGASQDVMVNYVTNGGFKVDSHKKAQKTGTVSVTRTYDKNGAYEYGYTNNFIEYTDPITGDPATPKSTATAHYGQIYYTLTVPKNATQYAVSASADTLTLTFNNISMSADPDEIQYATPGKYIVNLYTVKSLNKQGKEDPTDRGGKLDCIATKTFTVTNTQGKVTSAGLLNTKYVDATFTVGTKNEVVSDSTTLSVIANAIKVKYNGNLYYNDSENDYPLTLTTNAPALQNISIVEATVTSYDGRMFVKDITVEVLVDSDTTSYKQTQVVKVNKWLYEEQD